MTTSRPRVVGPHELIGIDQRQRNSDGIDDLRNLLNQLGGMSTLPSNIRKEQITQFTATVSELQPDRGVIEAAIGANHSAPDMLHRRIHHIEIPRNDAPLVCSGLVVKVIVRCVTEIDIPSGPVDRPKAVVTFEVEVLTPPRDRVQVRACGIEGITIGGSLDLSRPLVFLSPTPF